MNEQEILKKAIEAYGEREQSAVAMEECGELIRAINKMHRNQSVENRNELISEIADVQIMIEQLVLMYKLNPINIQRMKDYKISRLIARIQKSEETAFDDHEISGLLDD